MNILEVITSCNLWLSEPFLAIYDIDSQLLWSLWFFVFEMGLYACGDGHARGSPPPCWPTFMLSWAPWQLESVARRPLWLNFWWWDIVIFITKKTTLLGKFLSIGWETNNHFCMALVVDRYILVHVISWTAACPGTHGEGLVFDSILSGQSDFTEAICFNNIRSSRGSTWVPCR